MSIRVSMRRGNADFGDARGVGGTGRAHGPGRDNGAEGLARTQGPLVLELATVRKRSRWRIFAAVMPCLPGESDTPISVKGLRP